MNSNRGTWLDKSREKKFNYETSESIMADVTLSDSEKLRLVFARYSQEIQSDYPELHAAITNIIPTDTFELQRRYCNDEGMKKLRRMYAQKLDSLIKEMNVLGIRILWSEMLSGIRGASVNDAKGYIQLD